MLKKLLISFVLTFATCIAVRGQYDPEYTHFWMMETSFNPAAAGNEDALNITGAYSMQMTGFRNAPKTMFASADMPFIVLKKRNGVGLLFQNDALGLFSHKKFSAQYAFHIEKFFGGRLSIGAQADLLAEEFDGTKADVETSNDPAIPTTKVTGSKVDMSAGLFYRRTSWYVGASMAHILSPTVMLGETNELKIDPVYYLTGGYNIKLRNPLITIHPAVLCMYDGSDFRANISGRVELHDDNKKLFAGATYSPQHSAAAFVGGLFHGITVSYSYEAYTSMPDLKSGAHEIVLQYRLDMNLYKKGRNRHKSVRYL